MEVVGTGKKIAIVGAGFSGTAVAVMLSRFANQPLEIILFDKSGRFGAGDAYRTPYPWHILNVRARDMSAFEDQPTHFVDWISTHQQQYQEINNSRPIGEQFLPRYIYHHYLRDLLQQLQDSVNQHVVIKLVTAEVIDAIPVGQRVNIITDDNHDILVDKVVLALGNFLPLEFPFSVSDVQTIPNPWEYEAIERIPPDADVMIVGLGLTMIDTVLTLHQQQHRGKIYAISRHGMLPLPHTDVHVPYSVEAKHIPTNIRSLTKQLRDKSRLHMQEGGDWRSVINALRAHIPSIWEETSLSDKKRFIRHVLPYWNVHRHRVHSGLTDILDKLIKDGQLLIMAGRVLGVEHGKISVRARLHYQEQKFKIDWLINCMGPGMDARKASSPLLQSLIQRGSVMLDPLALGFSATATGNVSSPFFTLGPPTKGTVWECTAVPEIRRQSYALSKILMEG